MQTWLNARVEEIRERLAATDEGSLWLLLFDDPLGEPVLASAIDGAMAQMDPLMESNVAKIINELPVTGVLLAIPRRSGHPLAVDRQLCSALPLRIDPSTELIDVVIIGATNHWSARQLGLL